MKDFCHMIAPKIMNTPTYLCAAIIAASRQLIAMKMLRFLFKVTDTFLFFFVICKYEL